MNRAATGAQGGFTLIELLVVIGITSILLTLGAFAVRQFWFQRSLLGGQDQIATQLRALHQRVISEGVSGRYHGAWFDPGTEDWGTVRYESTASPACRSTGTFELDAGVQVDSVTVGTTAAEVDFSGAITACRSQLGLAGDTAFVWFLARGVGTETSGNDIRISQPRLGSRIEEIRVYGLTGRVEKST